MCFFQKDVDHMKLRLKFSQDTSLWCCTQNRTIRPASSYKWLAQRTLSDRTTLRPEVKPSGKSSDRHGGGSSGLRCISRARDAVPHGGATCTNMQKGLEIISKSNMVSLSSIRLSFTIGQGQNLGIMWSTATLSRRPLMRSWAVKRPDPANTSTP